MKAKKNFMAIAYLMFKELTAYLKLSLSASKQNIQE
jgi:hypothetical protein